MFALSKLKYKEAYLLTCDYHFNSFILKVELCRFTKHLKGGRLWVWRQCSTQVCLQEEISFIHCIFIYVCFQHKRHVAVSEWDFEGTLNIRTYLHCIAVSHANSQGCGHQSMSFWAKSPSFESFTQTGLHWQIWLCTGCECRRESGFFFRRRKSEIEREGMRRIEGRLVWRLGSSQLLSPSVTVRKFVRADWDTKMCVPGVLLEEDFCVYCALHLCLEFWIRCKNNLTICKSLLLGQVRNSRRGGCEGRLFIAWCRNKQPKTVKHKHRTKKHPAYKARLAHTKAHEHYNKNLDNEMLKNWQWN